MFICDWCNCKTREVIDVVATFKIIQDDIVGELIVADTVEQVCIACLNYSQLDSCVSDGYSNF